MVAGVALSGHAERMCGRYASARRDDELAHRFHVSELVGDELGPSWNVAPTQDVRGVLERVEADHPVRQLHTLRWGLVPSWAKDSKIGSRMINARVETITEKPAFRRAAAKRRLIVPMDGYYEWQVPGSGKGRKTPYYLTDPDGAPLAAAGLYELWRDPSKGADDPDRWLWSLTIITITVDPRVDDPGQLRRPSDAAIEAAQVVKARVGRRETAPVRALFVEQRDGAQGAAPPLARLLRGGRGGEVRLKLELSFLWFAVSPPHDLTYPARAWATLLDLEDPEGRGARRVRQAIKSLEANNLVTVENRPGQPGRILLLNESGNIEPYTPPGNVYNASRSRGLDNPHRYIQLPDTLWTSGWLATLSGAGLAMLLVLLTNLAGRPAESTDLWLSPDRATELYGLSDDTCSKGLRELRAVELITARRRSASRTAFDFRRLRNTYRLNLSRLADLAAVPVVAKPEKPMSPHDASLEDIFGGPLNKPWQGLSQKS